MPTSTIHSSPSAYTFASGVIATNIDFTLPAGIVISSATLEIDYTASGGGFDLAIDMGTGYTNLTPSVSAGSATVTRALSAPELTTLNLAVGGTSTYQSRCTSSHAPTDSVDTRLIITYTSSGGSGTAPNDLYPRHQRQQPVRRRVPSLFPPPKDGPAALPNQNFIVIRPQKKQFRLPPVKRGDSNLVTLPRANPVVVVLRPFNVTQQNKWRPSFARMRKVQPKHVLPLATKTVVAVVLRWINRALFTKTPVPVHRRRKFSSRFTFLSTWLRTVGSFLPGVAYLLEVYRNAQPLNGTRLESPLKNTRTETGLRGERRRT